MIRVSTRNSSRFYEEEGTLKQVTDYIPRHITGHANEVLDSFPAVVLEGARQVGKSTLAATLGATRDAASITLDDEGARAAAIEDPATFVEQHRTGLLVIDEVQRAPQLLLAIKASIDRDRRPSRFLLTGSSDLLRLPGSPESLAGRAVTVELSGFSQGELSRRIDDFVVRAREPSALAGFATGVTRGDYVARIGAGGYPEPQSLNPRMRSVWFDAYVERLVTRDARELMRAPDSARLTTLLRLLAANQSGELVKSRLARDAGIPETSVSGYLDVLRALFLVGELRPWTPNLTSREIGRSKSFVTDAALAMRLARLSEAALAAPVGAAHLGPQLEGFVVGELRKQSTWSSERFEMFHYRDRDGLEVDIVIELYDGRVLALEVKAGATPRADHFRALTVLREKLGPRMVAGIVLNTAAESRQFAERLWSLPIAALWEL